MKYASTRNFKNGAITKLSPYISRGAISTLDVYKHVKTLDLSWFEVEKLVQELAWREFFQSVWHFKTDGIFSDVKIRQINAENSGVPASVFEANTEIDILDIAVRELYNSGYLHNHLRMYLASVCCNISHYHWAEPAKWLYYNLLDGDLASNHLSWQWVAGSFSSKKYFANQDNLNKFFKSNQKNTFLDVDYSEFDTLQVPEILKESVKLNLKTKLPKISKPNLEDKKTLIFNYYNLDYKWHQHENYQKILLLEPSVFEKFPVSEKCIDFALKLSENIPNIKIFVGEFPELLSEISVEKITFKNHPLNSHYKGNSEKTNNLFTVVTECSSFFSYWKKVNRGLQKDFELNKDY